jgi:dGTPase
MLSRRAQRANFSIICRRTLPTGALFGDGKSRLSNTRAIIRDLFEAFDERPLSLIGGATLDPFGTGVAQILKDVDDAKDEGAWRCLEESKKRLVARAICDFIAGMTNPYAENYHRRLFEPGFGSSTDEL